MSSDSDVRSRVWYFTHTLHTRLEQHATRVLAATNVEPYNVLKQLFQSLILSTRLPEDVKFIQLRVPRVAFTVFESNARAGTPLPDLHFDGYIQSGKNKFDRDRLNPEKTNLIEIVCRCVGASQWQIEGPYSFSERLPQTGRCYGCCSLVFSTARKTCSLDGRKTAQAPPGKFEV